MLFDKMSSDTTIGINEYIPEYSEKISPNELDYAYFEINLNEHDQIYHENKLITEKELEALIIKFSDLNTNNSRFRIETTDKTKYEFYIYVENIVTLSVYKKRNLYSIDKYNKPFDKLDSKLKIAVEMMYPVIIY
jgi:biopolymer transport protein ExbD